VVRLLSNSNPLCPLYDVFTTVQCWSVIPGRVCHATIVAPSAVFPLTTPAERWPRSVSIPAWCEYVGLGAALGWLGEGALGAGGCADDGDELGCEAGPRADITGEGVEDCGGAGGCVGPGPELGLLLDDVAPVGDDECDEAEDEAAAFDGEELDEALDELSLNASDDVVGVGVGPSIGCVAAPASVWRAGVVPGTRIRPIPTATRLTPLTVAWRWVRNFTSPPRSSPHCARTPVRHYVRRSADLRSSRCLSILRRSASFFAAAPRRRRSGGERQVSVRKYRVKSGRESSS